MFPPSFPPSGPCSGAPFPPQGPAPGSSRSPASAVLRSTPTPCRSSRYRLRCLHPRGTTLVRLSLLREADASPGGRGCSDGFPNRLVEVEETGPPRFLGSPLAYVPRSGDPGEAGSTWPNLRRAQYSLPSLEQRRPSPDQLFRGSMTRPARSLSTLRSPGYPGATQDSLPAGGHLCRAGISPAGLHVRFRFRLCHHVLLIQAWPGALKVDVA